MIKVNFLDARRVRPVRLGTPNTAYLPYKAGGTLQRGIELVRHKGRRWQA